MELILKRDGVCNPVTHVSKAIQASKRFGRGCKPRPASLLAEVETLSARVDEHLKRMGFIWN